MNKIKWTIIRKDSIAVIHKALIDEKIVEIESAINRPYVVTVTSQNGEKVKTEYPRAVLRYELQQYLISTIKHPNENHKLTIPFQKNK